MRWLVVILLLLAASLLFVPIRSAAGGQDLAGLLPRPADVDGWTLDGKPQQVEGEDLFKLINGGAEEFLQIGFVRALDAVFKGPDGRTINVQVFEMKDRTAAEAIFGKKAGSSGESVEIGEEALAEDYFLSFRSGPFYVTLSGYDDSPATRAGLARLGDAIGMKMNAYE